MSNIDADNKRFHEIIRNKVKHNLGKYVASDKLIGQQGSKKIVIPIHSIDLPRFRFTDGNGGPGMGDGEPGDPIGGDKGQGKGAGQAGDEEGDHGFTAEFSPDELAQLLAEELQLPDLAPRGNGQVKSVDNKYTSIRKTGPESLKSFKRTYKEALKREIASGSYDPSNPKIIPIKDDKRYRSFDEVTIPDTNTAIIYMMDVSGSMGDEQKHIVKSEVFWINLWLTYQYKNIEARFIVHDTSAKEVTKDEFFTISESGGTMISSAYKTCLEMMQKDYPFSSWNVYTMHFSDSENWNSSDTEECIKILEQGILPNCNRFNYGHVGPNSTRDFFEALQPLVQKESNVRLSVISDEEGILPSIKTFFKE